MTNVIKKVAHGNQMYIVAGGGSAGDGMETVYLTQSQYDALTPEEKADTTKQYAIISSTSGSLDADVVNYDNTTSGATATDVQGALDEVFQSVSNGKELLADAITDKGVSTSATDSFQTMASNISSLDIATEGQIVAYNMAHSGKGNLLFSIAGSKDSSSDGQNLLLYNGIGGSNYEMYFIGLRTSNNKSEDYRCTGYKFFKDGTYTNTNVSTGATVSDNNNWGMPDWENWYTVSDERYRYAFVRKGENSYQSVAKFDTQTGTLTSDTTVTVNNSGRTLANIKTTLPYSITSQSTTTMYGDVHVFDILAKF